MRFITGFTVIKKQLKLYNCATSSLNRELIVTNFIHSQAAQYIAETSRFLLRNPPSPEDKKHNLRLMFGNGFRRDIWQEFVTRFNIPKITEFYASTEGNANMGNLMTAVNVFVVFLFAKKYTCLIYHIFWLITNNATFSVTFTLTQNQWYWKIERKILNKKHFLFE